MDAANDHHSRGSQQQVKLSQQSSRRREAHHDRLRIIEINLVVWIAMINVVLYAIIKITEKQ